MAADRSESLGETWLDRLGAARAVMAIIVVGALIRFLMAASFGLGSDESSNYSSCRHADLSYFDHPPMDVWLARLSLELFGLHSVALRAPTILLFAGTTWLIFALGRKLFGEKAGLFAALLLNLSMVFSIAAAALFHPDGPLMFFWLLTIYGLVHLMLTEKPRDATRWWLLVGAAAGCALLSKYHAVFLVLGTAIFVVTRKEQRHWLLHPGPYLGLLTMFACFVPVLLWNSQHQWVSFLFQGGRGTEFNGLRFDWLARSIGGQALWLLPWIWAPLALELYRCLRGGPGDAVRWFIACLAGPPILFFTIISLYAPIGFLFHWQAPGYLLLFLPLGASVERLLHATPREVRFTRRWLGFTAGAFLIALLSVSTHTVTGWWIHLLPEKLGNHLAKIDPTLELLDYSPLEPVLADHGLLDRDDVFVFTPKWFLSGKVDYALRGRANVMCLSPDDPRTFAFFDAQSRQLGKDGILIIHERSCDGMEMAYGNLFERMTLLATVDVPRGNRTAAKLKVFRGEKFRTTVPQPYGNSRETSRDLRTAKADP